MTTTSKQALDYHLQKYIDAGVQDIIKKSNAKGYEKITSRDILNQYPLDYLYAIGENILKS